MATFDDAQYKALLDDPNEVLEAEYKTWLDLSSSEVRADLARHIAALANYGGGSIVLGITNAMQFAPRVMMILHSLHIRSLQDLRTADEKLLAKHLTMTEIKAMKKLSGASNSPPKSHLLLSAANLPIRAVQALNAMGVIKIADLAEVSEADLRAQPKLGKTEMLAILRVCREHDLRLKGG
jgi:hypothetical protein